MTEEKQASALADSRASEIGEGRDQRKRNALIFCLVAVVWLVVDQVVKNIVAATVPSGAVIGPFGGIFQIRYVHNTGAAWGMFSDATFVLGVLSLVICAALVFYLFWLDPGANLGEAIGIALVVAGGIGNAFDRFTLGYVIDFIEPVFIDFPVFNIADIGVTCGFVIFIISLLVARQKSDEKTIPSGGQKSDETQLGQGDQAL